MYKDKQKDVGWKFPVKADELTGRIKTSSYKDDVSESIRIIIMTKKGERVMKPDFGCDIYKYMFDILDATTLKQIELEIIESIKKWEYRIRNLSVNVEESKENSGRLIINVSYVLIDSTEILNSQYIYDTRN